jgi:hypothetical protein
VTTDDPVAARQVRAAVGESARRDENEQNEEQTGSAGLTDYACECGRECAVLVSLTSEEYEDVRKVPTHFIAAPCHLVVGVEVVVRTTSRYLVVEKIGAAAAVAARLDPRGKPLRDRPAA